MARKVRRKVKNVQSITEAVERATRLAERSKPIGVGGAVGGKAKPQSAPAPTRKTVARTFGPLARQPTATERVRIKSKQLGKDRTPSRKGTSADPRVRRVRDTEAKTLALLRLLEDVRADAEIPDYYRKTMRPKTYRALKRHVARMPAIEEAERKQLAQTRKKGFLEEKTSGIASDLGEGALDILEQTTRPAEFIAGSFNEQIKRLKEGKIPEPVSAVKAGWESGVSRSNRKTFADVIRTGGGEEATKGIAKSFGASDKQAKKLAKSATEIGGLTLDIAADPTTYASFGVGGAAKGAARGITVGIGSARTSGKTSGKVLKKIGAPAAGRLVTESSAGKTARRIFPIRPKEIDAKTWAKLSRAERERRGVILHEQRRVARRARAVRKASGGTYRRVLPEREVAGGQRKLRPRRRKPAPIEASRRIRDAIEADDLSTLSKQEQMAAREVVRLQEDLLKARRASGEPAARYAAQAPDEPEGYVARQALFSLGEDLPGKSAAAFEKKQAAKIEKKAGGVRKGQRATTTEQDYERLLRGPMKDVREERPGLFLEDLETTLKLKAGKDITRAANTRYRKEVEATGRRVQKGKADYDIEREAVYDISQGKLTEVKRKEVAKRANTDPNNLVVLNKTVAEHANRQMEHVGRIPFIDNATNKIKWLLTIPNPQYWSRNAYGGLFNAWEEGASVPGLARAIPDSARISRRITKRHKADELLGAKLKPAGKLAIGPKGEKVDVDEFIDELEKVNIEGGGLTQELTGAESRRRSKAQAFEDLPRFTAYIHYRRQGLTPNEAADRALAGQFDYGKLTDWERKVARRIFPFYTWRSRNVVLQTKKLVQRPGRAATTEKFRDTLAEMAGLPEDWESKLTEGERLGVPIPIPGIGKQLTVYPGLPVTDLNMLSPKQIPWQLMGSTNPIAKSLIEFGTNYNFFFRDHIESEGRRWQAAPGGIIDKMPGPLREVFVDAGIIKQGKDRWTNKTIWQWRGKADYLAKLTPITSTLLQQTTQGLSRLGQTKGQRLTGYLTGVRPVPYQPDRNRLLKLYDERNELFKKQGDLEELRTHKRKGWTPEHSGESGWDTPEYKKVKKEMERVGVEIYKLEKKVGKKGATRPPGLKKKSSNPYDDPGGEQENPYDKLGKGTKNPYDDL